LHYGIYDGGAINPYDLLMAAPSVSGNVTERR